MENKDYLAELERVTRQLRSENEAELEKIERRLASMRFCDKYSRAPSSADELSQFIAQEEREAVRRRELATEAKEQMNAAYRSIAQQYDQWIGSLFLRLTKVLEHEKPDRTAAFRKLASTEPYLEAVDEAGGLSIGLPFGEPDLTGQAKAAFSALCQEFEGDHIGELEEALDCTPECFFFALPSAEFIDEGIPCLAFVAKVYGVIALSVSKKPSFKKNIVLWVVRNKSGHDENGPGYIYRFEASPPYFLGYHWHTVDLGWSSESLTVPIVLLDCLAKGQIEAEDVRVQSRQGDCTFYSVRKGSDETIAISDSFTKFLQQLEPPWYECMACYGIIDDHTSKIVQLKLTQAAPSSAASQQGWSDDDLIAYLTSPALGLSAVVAKEKLKILKGNNIDRNISLEDAVKLALRE
jgi:hypothetical protein